jgi:hypothetical protein
MRRGLGAVVVVGWLFAASGLFAQSENSEVLGTVRDPSAAPVPGATVTLTNVDTGIQARAVSDEIGNYDFFNVKVGRYSIVVEAAGFSRATVPDVTVEVGARQRVDVALQIGVITEVVSISATAPIVETDSSEHDQVIGTQTVVELPLNGRNFSDLALLSTNVHRSSLATVATPREGSFNANGMRSTYNNFLLDGVDNNAYSTSNQGFSNQVAQPSPDAVAEFKVITANYSAEYGRVGGAVVNSVMRSGTNQFHGTAYDFLRNTSLNSIGYIFGVRPATFRKPTLQRNQFGATFGGPLKKDRVFFFADYEGFRQLAKVLNFDSIPNPSDRAGILPVSVVNPLTGAVYAAGTTIPMTGFANRVLNDLPAVTGAGRSNDYQALLLTRDYSDKFDLKFDGQIKPTMTTFFRISQRKDNQFYQPDIPGPSGGNGNGFVRVLDQALAAGFTWARTPTSLIEIRFGVSRILGGKFPVYLGGTSMQDLYGIQGLPTSSSLTGGLNTHSISGFNQLGRQATNPQFQNPTNWAPKLNYSWIAGRHALKTGAELQGIRTEVMDINPVYGLNAYAGQFSKPTCAQLGLPATCTVPSDTASYNLADFMFGLPSQVQLANYLVGNYRQRLFNGFFQDDFRLNSKVTLNLGLRWEYASPRWERDNVLSNYDPVTNTMLKAKDGGISDPALVDPDYKNFGPRLGMAYTLDDRSVLRGGYGISYTHLNRLGSADELGINGPQVVIATVNQTPLLPSGQPNPAFITTQSGFPSGFDSPSAFNPVNANVAYIPRNTRWPYIQTWFVSVQRELTKNTVVELSYSGNKAGRLPIIADFNQALPNTPGLTLGVQARRPNQSFGAITWVDPVGSETYHGLSARVEHKYSSGLYLLNSFTWSKAMGNSEQALEYPSGYYAANPQNIYNLAAERGPSSFDVKLVNVTSLVYQIPVGKGHSLGSDWNPVFNNIFRGWQVGAINIANTGTPLDVSYTPTAANDVTGRIPDYRGVAIQRPNRIGNPAGATGADRLNQYYNPAAFAVPSASAPFGNIGRNSFRGPGFWQTDFSLNKNFQISEGKAVQFRSEFFNVFNHTNFGTPDSNISDAAFGTIRSTLPPRQIQFALKVIF